MEILDKKSNRMSRVIVGVSERSEFPKLQRILDFLSLRNLLSNELFFTFYYIATTSSYFILPHNFQGTLFFQHLQLLYEVSSYEFLVLYLMFFQEQ